MKNLGNMLKQAQQMQARMQEMQAKLEATVVEGQAGGGMVKVSLSGKGDLKKAAYHRRHLKPTRAAAP